MVSLKNWDNKTWLSTKKYIYSFNNFILKQTNLSKYSRILDIGCGRGKIIENLSERLKLTHKPIGLDIVNHEVKSKKIIFRKTDGLSYISKTKATFDLILIKQTIHLIKENKIKKLLSICSMEAKYVNPIATVWQQHIKAKGTMAVLAGTQRWQEHNALRCRLSSGCGRLPQLWAVFLMPELYAVVELYIVARTDEALREELVPVLTAHRENLLVEADFHGRDARRLPL